MTPFQDNRALPTLLI